MLVSRSPLIRSDLAWLRSCADCATTASCREAMMPLVIRCRSSCPTTSTTRIPSTTVAATTRSWMERRHCPSTSRSGRRSGPGTSRPASGRAISVRDCAGPATGPDVRATIRSARPGLVADAANSHDDLRTLGVALDLGPQTLHMDIDEPGVRRVPVTPDLFQQHLPGEDLPGLACERHEQVELQRSQRYDLAVATYRVTRDIDGEVPDLERLGRGLIRAPEPSPDPGDELLGLERLDDVVVGARLQAEDDVDRVGLGRQHDDRDPRLGADLPADLDAVLARQHDVEQHQVRPARPEGLQGLCAGRAARGGERPPAEADAQHLPQPGVAVDPQHTSPHARMVTLKVDTPGAGRA